MKVTIQKQPKSKVELTIEVTPKELDPYLDQAASNLSKDINIPGFRPGKAPRNLVEQKVGVFKVYEEAANLALPKTYVKVLIENDIEAIGPPQVKLEKLAPGNPMVYKATLSVLPEIKLPDYKKIKVKEKKVEVKDEQIENTLKEIQKSRAKIKTVSRAAQKGDRVEIDFKTYLNKVPIENGESKNHPLILGQGYFVPGFEKELIGMKEKEEKEFTLRFPQKYHQKHLADKDVDFKVKMNLVQEVELPKIDDQFAQSLGKFKDLQALKNQIKENLQDELEDKEKTRCEMEIMDKIAQECEMEIPEMLVEAELEKITQELKGIIETQGGNFENYLKSIKKTEKELKEQLLPQAKKRVKVGLILRAIAKKENIKISDQEVEEERQKTLQAYQWNKEIMDKIQTDDYKEYLRGLIRNRKVFALLRKSALS